MNKKIKSKKNLANDVETKPPIPMLPPRQRLLALPEQLRQMTVQALLTGSPKQLSVGEVNQICNALNTLPPVKD